MNWLKLTQPMRSRTRMSMSYSLLGGPYLPCSPLRLRLPLLLPSSGPEPRGTVVLIRRMGLNLSEMAALEHLQHASAEGLTPTQLGRRLSRSPGAVTALVDRLERAGHVKRRPNPKDCRSSVVGRGPL